MKLPPVFSRKIPIYQVLVPCLIISVLFLTLLTGALLYHGAQDGKLEVEIVRISQADHLLAGEKVIQQEVKRLQSDLEIAAHLPGLKYCLNDPRLKESRSHVAIMFSAFLRYKPYYYQIRFLDTSGLEIVRVERQKERIIITDKENLQDKSKRYYIRAMANLDQEGIYISPLDLNVEHGKISSPRTPTLRLGKAVFDDRGQKTGFVVLNYRGSELLSLYRTVLRSHEDLVLHVVKSKALLVDRDGQYLLAGDQTDEWGLFLNHGRTFSQHFPDLWQQMQNQKEGQWLDTRGLLTFQRIKLIQGLGRFSINSDSGDTPTSTNTLPTEGLCWYLLSHVTPEEMEALMSLKNHFHWNIFLALLPLILLTSWLSALLLVTNRINRQQLSEQRHHFRLLYNQAPLPYQSLDPNSRLLEVNRAWHDILGYEKEEITGIKFSKLLTQESRLQFQQSFAHLIKTGKPIRDHHLSMIKKDGSLLPVALYCQLRRDPGDNCIRTHGVFIDITELERNQKRINHLNLILKTIVRIHRAIASHKNVQELLDECCRILTESRGYQSSWIILMGRDNRPTIQANNGLLHDFNGLLLQINKGTTPPCIREVRQRNTALAIFSPKSFCDLCPMANAYPSAGIMCAPLKHDDHFFGYFTVSLPMQLARDEEELQRFEELAEDIGLALFTLEQQQLRKTTERKLCQTLQILQESQEIALIGNYERNWQTGEGFWSDSTYNLFGYEPGEIDCTHENFIALIVPEDRKRIITLLERAKKFKNSFATDFRITRKDKSIRIIHGTGHCIFDAGGHPLLIRGLFQDVTDQRNMEAQILQTEKLTTIAGLAAGVSHELNTPLSAILQSIQVIEISLNPDHADNQATASASGIDLKGLQEYFKHKQIDYFFQGIKESAVRASSIIRDLLNFSRPRQEKMIWVDINALIESSIKLAHADFNLKKEYDIINVKILKEYEPNLPKVCCVAMEIEQVLLNLIKNAVQAMVETEVESCLTLRTKPGDDIIRIEVEDNGPGIDEKTQTHIFDPFFTTKEVGKGTGLGLSIAYGIIYDKHQGTIEVKSTPDRGTTFIINLPTEQTISSRKDHTPITGDFLT